MDLAHERGAGGIDLANASRRRFSRCTDNRIDRPPSEKRQTRREAGTQSHGSERRGRGTLIAGLPKKGRGAMELRLSSGGGLRKEHAYASEPPSRLPAEL